MTQVPIQTPAQRPTDDDPIAHLHKMSTTAGLGSGDYVAVNAVAVAALLVGLASTVTLADNVMLVVPLVGVILGIVALLQISRSNGTQTGRALAWAGMILSIAFVVKAGGSQIHNEVRTRQDRQRIGELIDTFGKKTREGNFDGVYALFSTRFAERVPRDEFEMRLKFVQESPLYGKLEAATWTGLAQFFTEEDSGVQNAAAQIQLKFDKSSGTVRESATFRKIGDRWFFESLPTIFPPKGQQQQQ